MEEYRQIVRLARKVGLAPTGSFNTEDVKNAKEIVYALCDKLDDPKEIMQYVRTVDEMMNVWEL